MDLYFLKMGEYIKDNTKMIYLMAKENCYLKKRTSFLKVILRMEFA